MYNSNSSIENTKHPARSLDQLQRRVPVIGDKAVIDLINGIQVNRDILRYRRTRGIIGQILDNVNGNDRQRQILLDGNLIAGQEILHHWVLEVVNSLRVSQVALGVTQQSLLETRQAVRTIKQQVLRHERDLNTLVQGLSELQEQLNSRFNEIEKRIHQLEIRVSANEDLDRIFRAWTAGQTYSQFPWTIQIVLLAKEIFSSPVLNYELDTRDRVKYRTLLVNKILSSSLDLPKHFFNHTDLLEYTWKQMSDRDRSMAHALLEVHSLPRHRLLNIPVLFTLGKTLELATLTDEARPDNPGHSAFALCRTQIDSISHTTDSQQFITTVIDEIANDHLSIMLRG
ncbi:MAG: hypothetical protein N5P05_000597 [Chroococcopsis gigantea SAG 12.99]|jgi:hypothetical protein|nr:hypothetical protein [Chlorogloea purpurea SAG 13.99]MDV2998991.1 hypothetical protein [Chroococcopsis gigantea SAG 12.99]